MDNQDLAEHVLTLNARSLADTVLLQAIITTHPSVDTLRELFGQAMAAETVDVQLDMRIDNDDSKRHYQQALSARAAYWMQAMQ